MHMLVQKKLLPRESGIFSLELPRPSETRFWASWLLTTLLAAKSNSPAPSSW